VQKNEFSGNEQERDSSEEQRQEPFNPIQRNEKKDNDSHIKYWLPRRR
jgi:hypothetical protein